jgi:hypothetical protein
MGILRTELNDGPFAFSFGGEMIGYTNECKRNQIATLLVVVVTGIVPTYLTPL